MTETWCPTCRSHLADPGHGHATCPVCEDDAAKAAETVRRAYFGRFKRAGAA